MKTLAEELNVSDRLIDEYRQTTGCSPGRPHGPLVRPDCPPLARHPNRPNPAATDLLRRYHRNYHDGVVTIDGCDYVRHRTGKLVPLVKGGSLNTWQETLNTQQAAGTLFNTYTTAKSVINAQALVVLPAGFWIPGKMVRVEVQGGISNIGATSGSTTFQVMMGSIVVFTGGAMNFTTTAHVTIPFWATFDLTCRAVGSGTAANLMGQGFVEGQMFTMGAINAVADAAANTGWIMAPNTAPAVGTGFDSTIANVLDFWVAFSISQATNGVQVQQYKVISLN